MDVNTPPVGVSRAAQARLWLVRHATPLIAPGTCYGHLDVPADTAATQAAATHLAAVLPDGVPVMHSTLQRCEQLALDLKALRPDLTVLADPRLREMNFGAWEGQRWDAIGKAPIDAWTTDFAHSAPGGGECLAAMLQRVSAALLAAQQQSAAHSGSDVVWITHAGVARCVRWLQRCTPGQLPQADQWPPSAPSCGAWEITGLWAALA